MSILSFTSHSQFHIHFLSLELNEFIAKHLYQHAFIYIHMLYYGVQLNSIDFICRPHHFIDCDTIIFRLAIDKKCENLK